MMPELRGGSRVYFLAICGTGMSALAGLLKERGCIVAGSDIAAYPPVGDLLKSLQIPVCLSYDVEDLKKFKPDYVVIGNFIRRDNPQAQYVVEQQIPYGSFPSTLENYFLQKTTNFVVIGTHGKTTTTACLSHLLTFAKLDPSFLIGGVPVNFEKSFHVGKGSHFVMEGDEYDTAFFDKESKFLHYRPTYGLFMSMEFDHADIFANNEIMEKMFRKFVHLIPSHQGALIYCRDWKRVCELIEEEKLSSKCISFGFDSEATYQIKKFKESESGMEFTLDGIRFTNSMTGRFNAQNFAAAIIAAREAGVSDQVLAEALASFNGVKRRQEVRAKIGEHLVIDDFAHHPTAVREVLSGLRAKYPRHQLVVFFEPRSNTSRRKVLQTEFENAFDGADQTFLAAVFKEEALPENDRLDIQKIKASHASRGKVVDGPLSQDEMIEKSVQLSKKKPSAFIILSNGSFNALHEKLISALKLQ
jgi:UDP-N-acetylmuramate: L-alanyl-gamma-D-glutamyl-meso-diaminopimelate ligase